MQYIYIASNGSGFVKIGISQNPERRSKEISWANENGVEVIYQSKQAVSNARKIERIIHKKYHRLKKHSEWFKVEDIQSLIQFIEKCVAEQGVFKTVKKGNKDNIFAEYISSLQDEKSERAKRNREAEKENKDIFLFARFLNGAVEKTKSEYAMLICKFAKDKNEVENLERIVASLIGIGWGYEQIKTFLFENATKKLE